MSDQTISRWPRALATALALTIAFSACDDDETVNALPDEDIVSVAQSAGSFSTLLTALDAAGLTSTLSGGGPFTVFAPTDEAFDALPSGVLDGLLADTDALTEVLLYHVVQGELTASDLDGVSSVTTLQGQQIAVTAGSVILNGVTVSQADIMADNGVIHVIGEVLLPPSLDVPSTAAGNSDFSILATALSATGLDNVLAGEGPFTIFAPTDAAFDALPAARLDALLADPGALTEVLLYHAVAGRVYSGDLEGVVSTETLVGFPLLFDLSDGAKVNDANILATNVLATNGVIHVIDKVLLPPTKDIVQTAVDAGFSTLATALGAADLVATLQGEGPFTVFAPTDDAFATLPDGALEALLEDIDALTSVLLYHVVDGQVFSGNLSGVSSAETLSGESISIDLSDGVKINDATVIIKDIIATNGVIHVIDSVLLPN
ncbi:MAG: fasciclin domain-containing protein [Gemmatimonadota bacterium]|nr:MAG: fasciclin domain-containing protein [Gemmatimonadota bacterium]